VRVRVALLALLVAVSGCSQRAKWLKAPVGTPQAIERLDELLAADTQDAALHARLAVHHLAAGSPDETVRKHLDSVGPGPFDDALAASAFLHDCERIAALKDAGTPWARSRASAVCAPLPPPPFQECKEGGPGGLSKDVIFRSMVERSPAVKAAYELAMAAADAPDVDVDVEFVIDAEGTPRVTRLRTTPLNRAVERALGPIITAAPFAKPCGGGIVTVNFPYKLRAKETADGN